MLWADNKRPELTESLDGYVSSDYVLARYKSGNGGNEIIR